MRYRKLSEEESSKRFNREFWGEETGLFLVEYQGESDTDSWIAFMEVVGEDNVLGTVNSELICSSTSSLYPTIMRELTDPRQPGEVVVPPLTPGPIETGPVAGIEQLIPVSLAADDYFRLYTKKDLFRFLAAAAGTIPKEFE